MSTHPQTFNTTTDTAHGTFKSYIIGFILSIVLTGIAFGVVESNALTEFTLTATIISLAFIQVLVQLVFFLHLGKESKPYWNMLAFLFTVLVLVILVCGTLWIMHNLNVRMIPPLDEETIRALSIKNS